MRCPVVVCGVLMSVGACFGGVTLEPCEGPETCPPATPLCLDGACFHHTVGYVHPVCASGEEQGPGCCALDSEEMGGGCVAWTEPIGALHSPAVTTPDGGFALVQCGATACALRRLAADGTESWSVDLGPAQAQGDLPVPAVAADGGITVGTVDGPVCVSADGKVLAGDTTSGLAPLRLSACSGGSVFVLTSEGLVVYPGQAGPYEVPVAGMDEVVPGGPGPLVFPELQRALLQTGAARVALVSTGDAPGEIWSSVLPPGAGEISGMGADRNGRAYVVAGNGVVLTYDVHADDRSLRFAWAPSTSPGATVAAGPLLPEAGVVLVGGPDGVWQIRWPEKMPELLAAPAGATTALIALRLGGLAAVRSRPDGTSVLEFAVAAGSLPEPRDAAGGTVVRRMELPCAAPQASAPQEQGMMAVACGDTLLGIVAPETRQRDAPWPMQRGAGNSGCVE